MLSSFSTSMVMSTSSLSPAEPVIDGRCSWDEDARCWTCKWKAFACDRGYWYFGQRMELEKAADRQGATDGKNGRCLYSHESNRFSCSRTGFVYVDDVLCADRRTEEQKKEDEDKGARTKRKKYVRDAAIGGTFGGKLGISILCCYCRCCCSKAGRSWRWTQRGHKCGARDVQRKRDVRDAIELDRIGVMEEQTRAKLEREVEDAPVKVIRKAKVGSLEQKDLISQWERIKAAEKTMQVLVRQPVCDGNTNDNEAIHV